MILCYVPLHAVEKFFWKSNRLTSNFEVEKIRAYKDEKKRDTKFYSINSGKILNTTL